MSEKEGAAQKVDKAIRAIEEARKLNTQQQAQFHPGTAAYGQCEKIDDKLFEALTCLGE